MFRPWIFLTALLGLWLTSTAWGQGVLVIVDPDRPVPLPRPIILPQPQPQVETPTYKIKEIAVQARIADQVARTQVSQTFVNTGSRQMEVSFVFPLPHQGAIESLTFMVDGKEIAGKLMKAKDARQIYQEHVRKNQDPALLEWMNCGMFKTSIFPVPAGAERKVTLRYNQLLKKDNQLTDFLYPLATARYTSKPVENVKIDVSIETKEEIKSVYSPTHAVKVDRSGKTAKVTYEGKNEVPTTDFRLFFDTNKEGLGASVLSYKPESGDDGYFLLLASPEVKSESAQRPPKTVIFVLDRSGSMSGKKIEQAREAVKFVLNNLRQGDTFNIVAYDNNIESFKPELQRFDDETRKAAIGFIEGQYPGGSTNIEGALKTALGMLKDESRPSFVLFLTDGLPTAGETSEAKIVHGVKEANKAGARLINLGVGYDVNSRLLDRLSGEHSGRSEYVRPNESIEAHVSRVYQKISSPALTDVEVKLEMDSKPEEGPIFNRRYPAEVSDIFEGEQLVLVGRYKKGGNARVTVTGKVGDSEQKFDFPIELAASSSDQSYAFVEKLWAMRRIGEIIDELDLKGKNEELVKELVDLSTRHGILTPYTAFLADETQAPQLAAREHILKLTKSNVERLGQADGIAGVAQRFDKKQFREARQIAPGAPAAEEAAPLDAAIPGQRAQVRNRPAPRIADTAAPTASTTRHFGAAGLNVYRDIETDTEVLTDSVLQVGNESIYRRGNVLIANNARDIDPEKDSDKIKTIERFSDAYFKLVAANTAQENAILARQQAGEELIIKLRGEVYRIK